MTSKENSKSLDWMIKTPIAHRGLHDKSKGCFENTLSATKAAMEAGFNIEVDLHPSKDLVPMIFHDNVLDRLTNEKGPFRARTALELADIKIGNTQDYPPSLRQLLDLVDGKVGLVLELKGMVGEDDGFVEAVLKELSTYDGPVAIMSFNQWLLKDAHNLGSKVPVGLTAEGGDELGELFNSIVKELDMDFVSYGVKDLPNLFVKEFRKSGKPVITWTVRTPEQAEYSLQYIDQITFEGFQPDNS